MSRILKIYLKFLLCDCQENRCKIYEKELYVVYPSNCGNEFQNVFIDNFQLSSDQKEKKKQDKSIYFFYLYNFT